MEKVRILQLVSAITEAIFVANIIGIIVTMSSERLSINNFFLLEYFIIGVAITLHTITLMVAIKGNYKYLGSVVGIIASILNWVPIVGWVLHIVAFMTLLDNFNNNNKNIIKDKNVIKEDINSFQIGLLIFHILLANPIGTAAYAFSFTILGYALIVLHIVALITAIKKKEKYYANIVGICLLFLIPIIGLYTMTYFSFDGISDVLHYVFPAVQIIIAVVLLVNILDNRSNAKKLDQFDEDNKY